VSAFTDRDFQNVLSAISDGASLASACKPSGRPSKDTVLRRTKSDAEFSCRYEEAMAARAEVRVGQLVDVNDKLLKGEIDPSSARVVCENLRWLAGKDSSRFADRQRTELTGRDGAPLLPEPKPVDLFEEARYIASILWRAGIQSVDQMNPAALIEASTR